MQRFWRLLLPLIGLVMFGAVTYHAVRRNSANPTSRYFWWSAVRLDKDPLNTHPKPQTVNPCPDRTADCVTWDPESVWIEPGLLPSLLIVSALPAFAVGKAIVRVTGHFGISQVPTFMLSMPVLIVGWYYLLGLLIDRWRLKRYKRLAANSSSCR